MATKKLPRIPRLAQFQVVVHGLAGGPIVMLVYDPGTKTFKVVKIPDPRLRLAASLRVLAAAADLDSKMATQIVDVIRPALERHLP
ncbi:MULTISPECIES: hypothetical protein [unclassified Lysobacter]|uniref:hypothetical protein n=1 Tax=unclassified Lysobacter TaxID=2635362 RepID=UPI001C22DF08|nr:hypothetical protein [Lysobacter sp. MMG2]MBU8977220.1 hypothetical protein [Lysobacter sp. MMG2]